MINKDDKEILIDAVLYDWHICQLKFVMIDCKINNVNKNAVNISDEYVFKENLIYILKSDVLTVNVTETERIRRTDLRVEKVKTERRIWFCQNFLSEDLNVIRMKRKNVVALQRLKDKDQSEWIKAYIHKL